MQPDDAACLSGSVQHDDVVSHAVFSSNRVSEFRRNGPRIARPYSRDADMKPTISNAFTRNPRKSLAASLASLRADLRETGFGWSLALSPMQASDAVEALTHALPDEQRARSVYLVAAELLDWRGVTDDMTLADIVARLGITALEQFADDQVAVQADSLTQLVALCPAKRLLIVEVEGPIEGRDAIAMNKALDARLSPLDVEIRATAAMEICNDRTVTLHVRDKNRAIDVVAENFRHYLAALRDRSVAHFAPPALWQLERLFTLTGALTVRPIETQVFSTSIDVGINTSRDEVTQPADRSLIFDVPSNTWHDEP
jgi:hypothetical protein